MYKHTCYAQSCDLEIESSTSWYYHWSRGTNHELCIEVRHADTHLTIYRIHPFLFALFKIRSHDFAAAAFVAL